MDAASGTRTGAGGIPVLVVLLAAVLPVPALAQASASASPPEPRWLLAPRLPASADSVQTAARPPGMAAGAEDDLESPMPERRPVLAFTVGQREPEPPGYFSIKDPCAQENLNRNDEPLSQRIDCQGLGVPSGWFHPSNTGVQHRR